MLQAAEWEPIDDVIRRACWRWLGHVARMKLPSLPLSLLCGVGLLSLERELVVSYMVLGLPRCWL